MPRSFARGDLLGAVASLGGAAALAPLAGPAHAAAPGPAAGARPDGFPLPDGFRPEGITIGRDPYAHLGSLANGDVYRVAPATGRGEVVVRGGGADHPRSG